MRILLLAVAGATALFPQRALTQAASAQAACTNGKPLAGTVVDTTGALIPGASLTLDAGAARTSGNDGRFRFPCVPAARHHLTVAAPGFAPLELNVANNAADLTLTLTPSASAEINVQADAADLATPLGGPNGTTLAGNQLQALADDPDDLTRELQQLAAASGSNPANATISVDGFQSDSPLPPKSSIAFIKVNPDLFSAEYRQPPYEGGRIEIYTKPGASAFHGALFTTNSSQWMNARDPFSLSRAAIGKQRYGFELNGPVRKAGSNFSVALEHRGIDDFAVVNAVTLDPSGNQTSTVANVPTPQRLWVGTARVDWQLGPKNIAFVAYSANVNHLANVGVGGIALAETGYDSGTYDHTLRFSDVTTVSPRLLHEARVSLDWRGETDVPVSSAPQVVVSGSFTGGGASLGQQRISEFRTEWDDDIILTAKNHNLKAGLQLFTYGEQRTLATNFNGSYTFGGGPAPVLNSSNQPTGQTANISGLEQYRRTLLALPGGTPTQFSGTTGNPQVNFTETQFVLFVQDDWKLAPSLSVSFGLRSFLQSDPTELANITPRFGVTWTPDQKKTVSLHAHLGFFSGHSGRYAVTTWSEFEREDGTQRVTSLVYNPTYGNPFSAGASTIHSERTLDPGFRAPIALLAEIGGSKTFPHGWTLSTSVNASLQWRDGRTLNVNTPVNGQPTGPRPYASNLNIYCLVSDGRGIGDVEFVGLSQQKLKWLQLFFGAVRVNIHSDSDDDAFFSPQSDLTDRGEYARQTGNSLWQTFGNTTFHLPLKVQISTDFYAEGNSPYNITTGFDNNGDGNFNDRPQFALSPSQTGAVSTRYGLLVATGGTGILARNRADLPWNVHFDANVQRVFALTRNAKADHKQALTANVRSSNLLNHTNVTGEGGVLGSSLFGVPYAADNGRRIEGGLRYSF